jgi:hypothetical protein
MVALESIYDKVNWLSLVAIYPVAINTQRYTSLQLLCLMQRNASCNINVAIELLLPITWLHHVFTTTNIWWQNIINCN